MTGSAIEVRITPGLAGAQLKACAREGGDSASATDGSINGLGGGKPCCQQLGHPDGCLASPSFNMKFYDPLAFLAFKQIQGSTTSQPTHPA